MVQAARREKVVPAAEVPAAGSTKMAKTVNQTPAVAAGELGPMDATPTAEETAVLGSW